MAPLLIDSRDLLKLGFLSVLLTMLVFAGGFLMGHQQAAVFYQAGSDIRPLPLPQPVNNVESAVDTLAPSIVEAGEEIDVDQPEIKIMANNNPANAVTALAEDSSPLVLNASENKEIPNMRKSTDSAVTEAIKVGALTESSERGLDAAVKSKKSVNNRDDKSTKGGSAAVNASVSSADVSIVTALTSDELSKIKYSIQVGVYGRLINAENMMEMLQAQQHDAYVTDYKNKKNEIRYNVRFGYFSDKKSALSALAEFKDGQKGDGYLVKFSSDNIVKIAGVADIEKIADVPAHANETDKGLSPVIAPSVITQDKVSQADVLGDMPVAAQLTATN